MTSESLRQKYVSGEIELEEFEARIGAHLRSDDWGWKDGSARKSQKKRRPASPFKVWLGVARALLLPVALVGGVGYAASIDSGFDGPSAAQIAAAQRGQWRSIDAVAKAESASYRQTGRYTTDWTTLELANRSLGADATDVDISLTEDRKGAIISYQDFSYTLRVVMDGGKPERACIETVKADHACHKVQKDRHDGG